ncbi:hypothetical protein Hanom_Chr09g00794741 [Helianthus anomalus]
MFWVSVQNEYWKQLATHGFECSGFSPVDSVQSRYGFGSGKAAGSKLIKDGQNQQLVRDSTRSNSVNRSTKRVNSVKPVDSVKRHEDSVKNLGRER